MIRHRFILGMRNKLASLAADCDSCAAIEGSRLTRDERKDLQELIRNAYKFIDKKLGYD